MFERPDSRHLQIAALQRGVRGLDRTLSRLSGAVTDRVPAARNSAQAAFEDVEELGDRFRDGAQRAGNEAMRWGRQAAKFGEMSVDRLAKDIGLHPFMIVGIALGIGAIIGTARYRPLRGKPVIARRHTRARKGNSK